MKRDAFYCFLLVVIVLLLFLILRKPVEKPEPKVVKAVPEAPKMKVQLQVLTKKKPAQSASVKKTSNKKLRKGQFPVILANYEHRLGFDRYMSEMELRGAILLMRSNKKSSFVQLQYRAGQVQLLTLADLEAKALSSRYRLVSDQRLEPLISKARSAGATGQVYLLISQSMEGQLRNQFWNKYPGEEPVVSLEGEYQMHASQLRLKVQKLNYKGSSEQVNFDIYL